MACTRLNDRLYFKFFSDLGVRIKDYFDSFTLKVTVRL